MSSKSVLPERCAIVSSKGALQECLTRALRNSVKQGCPTRVSPQRVNSGCLTSGFAGKCEKWVLSLFLNIRVGIRVRGLHLVFFFHNFDVAICCQSKQSRHAHPFGKADGLQPDNSKCFVDPQTYRGNPTEVTQLEAVLQAADAQSTLRAVAFQGAELAGVLDVLGWSRHVKSVKLYSKSMWNYGKSIVLYYTVQ